VPRQFLLKRQRQLKFLGPGARRVSITKRTFAQCPSVTGLERLELRFYKHEFGNIAVSLPESRDLKSYKSLASQLSQNKVSVTLAFDGAPPVSETWAILQDPDSGKQLLAPRANYTKLYEQVLKSKRIAVSYPDKDGKLIESVFDVSATPAQVKAHNEKIHHLGVMDVLGNLCTSSLFTA
jgi:hypothetical protein